MEAKFDVLEYMAGLTNYVFDKSVLKRIAMERGVLHATNLGDIDGKARDLIYADMLLVVYLSPNTIASRSKSHGSYSQSVGSQVVSSRSDIYNMLRFIYKRWNDEKLQDVENLGGCLQWME